MTTGRPKKMAGSMQFNSVGWGNNRASIYGSAVDFSADYTATDRTEMIKRIRWGERNCGLVRQVFNDFVLYGIGDGITHQSHCQDTASAQAYDDYFKNWCRNAEHSGRFTFQDVQRLALRGAIRDGDIFVLKIVDDAGQPRVQIVEGHRVGNPIGTEVPKNMLDGVQFDGVGRLVGYSIIQANNQNKILPASSVCHIAEHDYASGSRGLPILQHSWNDIQTEDELLRLEALAVRNDADVTRVLKKNGGFIPGDMKSELQGAGANLDNVASKMGGKLIALEPGEDLVSLASNRPSPVFVGFLKAVQQDIARGVLPYEFVSDASGVSGSGIRLVTAKADRVFNRWQSIIIDKLCNPIWGFVIGSAIAKGELPDNPDWASVSWTTPKRLTVDAGREAANDRADVELGLLSMSELYAQRGLDMRSEMAKRAKDMKYIFDLSQKEGIPLWTLYKPGFNWLQQGVKQEEQGPGSTEQINPSIP